MERQRILVSGASGYVGGRLVPRLLQQGYIVRCLAREPRKLLGKWEADTLFAGQLEVVQGDVLRPETLDDAMLSVDAAYYLIHAMGEGEKGFEARDRTGAHNFATAAQRAGVGRIIYLGGLGRASKHISPHLQSRHETADVLRECGVPVTELRAAIIVGSGSAAYEMLRHMTEKLPVMICPRWVDTRTQPIFINDALAYLIAALQCPETAGKTLDIGGPDVLTYKQMMQTYADVRHLRRIILPVPVLTPRLSAFWVNLMTPIPASIAFPLIEGLRSETIVENEEAQRLMPIPLTSFREAMERATAATRELRVPTFWSGANSGAIPMALDLTPVDPGNLLRDVKRVETTASAIMLRRAFSRVGGRVGWYYADWLWDVRGLMDRIIGGVGVRRGRRHPEQVSIGDAIDFWRVEDYNDHRMLLRAEMKVPGRAWLEFCIEELPEPGRRALVQTAYYFPDGIAGRAYWASLIPFHLFIFSGMSRRIVQWAERTERIENEVHQNNAAMKT